MCIDQNEWGGNGALSGERGEQNTNWQSSNSVQQYNEGNFSLGCVIHPVANDILFFIQLAEEPILKHKSFSIPTEPDWTRQLFYFRDRFCDQLPTLCFVNIVAPKEIELFIVIKVANIEGRQ